MLIEKYRQDMKEMLAKKDEQLQRKDEQLQPVPSQRESPRHLIAAACAILKCWVELLIAMAAAIFFKIIIKCRPQEPQSEDQVA